MKIIRKSTVFFVLYFVIQLSMHAKAGETDSLLTELVSHKQTIAMILTRLNVTKEKSDAINVYSVDIYERNEIEKCKDTAFKSLYRTEDQQIYLDKDGATRDTTGGLADKIVLDMKAWFRSSPSWKNPHKHIVYEVEQLNKSFLDSEQFEVSYEPFMQIRKRVNQILNELELLSAKDAELAKNKVYFELKKWFEYKEIEVTHYNNLSCRLNVVGRPLMFYDCPDKDYQRDWDGWKIWGDRKCQTQHSERTGEIAGVQGKFGFHLKLSYDNKLTEKLPLRF